MKQKERHEKGVEVQIGSNEEGNRSPVSFSV